MKIVYCFSHRVNVGGIEAITSFKANAFVQKGVTSVWILHTEQINVFPFVLSPAVHLVDLGIRYYDNTLPFPLNLLRIGRKRCLHKKSLRRILTQIQPDIVISTGGQEVRLLPRIKGPWKTIWELHFSRNSKRMNAQSLRDRLFAWTGEKLDFERALKQYDHIVVLTHEEKKRYWPDRKNVSVIPNSVRFKPGPKSLLSAQRVLAVGRLSPEKNFSSLIRAFALVHPLFPEWSLDIFGDGDERKQLLSEIEKYNLVDVVHLPGSTNDVQKEMLSSSLLVCSSKHEGFAMVIVEAMACGLPVVSYDCPSGPKDIISNGNNGFLVPAGDENALADRICRLIESAELRKRMGAAAFENSKKYSAEQITAQWMDLFEELGGPLNE